LMLLFRKNMRPVTRYTNLKGQVEVEKLHQRSSKRAPRCDVESIDIHLQNKLQLTAREAARAREALVEIWKEELQTKGLVWMPLGVLVVAKVLRIKRTANSSRAELAKLLQHMRLST